jgi:hypothetical protein
MKKKIITAITAFAVFCSSIIAGTGMNAQEAKASETGTVYYVSTLHGRNSNDGKSEKTPFYSLQKINELELKPGDKVLLECGSVFTDGYLHLYEQSGSKAAPIVIDKYGEGSLPVIDTNGQGVWFQNYGNRLDAASHKKYGCRLPYYCTIRNILKSTIWRLSMMPLTLKRYIMKRML